MVLENTSHNNDHHNPVNLLSPHSATPTINRVHNEYFVSSDLQGVLNNYTEKCEEYEEAECDVKELLDKDDTHKEAKALLQKVKRGIQIQAKKDAMKAKTAQMGRALPRLLSRFCFCATFPAPLD